MVMFIIIISSSSSSRAPSMSAGASAVAWSPTSYTKA